MRQTKKVVSKKEKATTKKQPAKKIKSLDFSMDMYDIQGKVIGKTDLPKEIFNTPVNNNLMAQAIRVYLTNQRQGTSSTKTRGEVQGSTRKIYRQKGTGRARHGSIRAPLFVHGGVAFGPKPRDFSLKFPKKMRQKALFSALTVKAQTGEVKIVKGLEDIQQKTKVMASILEKLGYIEKGRKVLIIIPKHLENVYKASRNIQGVQITPASQINTYEVLNTKALMITESSIDALKNHFLKEKN